MASSRYPIPAARHRAELAIDRSRFVCTLAQVESPEHAQQFVREVGQEFSDATHNCWAYVIGPPGSTDRIGLSDDGEPHGTAGRPMLTVLQHSALGDIAAVVTRYYGGTKLGTGGLVKAYGGAVQHALETVSRSERVARVDIVVRFVYSAVSAVQLLLPTLDVETVAEDFGEDVRVHVRCPEEHVDAFRQGIQDITRGQAIFGL